MYGRRDSTREPNVGRERQVEREGRIERVSFQAVTRYCASILVSSTVGRDVAFYASTIRVA